MWQQDKSVSYEYNLEQIEKYNNKQYLPSNNFMKQNKKETFKIFFGYSYYYINVYYTVILVENGMDTFK